MTPQPPKDSPPAPSLVQVLLSVLAAFFGVQSKQNRERDFGRGKAIHYIVVGGVMTILLIVALISLVKWVLHAAGV
jgi:hypothetical protein